MTLELRGLAKRIFDSIVACRVGWRGCGLWSEVVVTFVAAISGTVTGKEGWSVFVGSVAKDVRKRGRLRGDGLTRSVGACYGSGV